MTTWLWLTLAFSIANGIRLGFHDRFGPDILDGIRRYRRGEEPRFIEPEDYAVPCQNLERRVTNSVPFREPQACLPAWTDAQPRS